MTLFEIELINGGQRLKSGLEMLFLKDVWPSKQRKIPQGEIHEKSDGGYMNFLHFRMIESVLLLAF